MKRHGATAVAMVVMLIAAFTGVVGAERPTDTGGGSGGHNGDRPDDPGAFLLDQSVIYGERVVIDGVNYAVYMDGSLLNIDELYVNEITGNSWPMFWQDTDVQADWSDNLVLHQWEAGDKIRTEVILIDVVDPSLTVYSITASFAIEYWDISAGEYVEIWSGRTVDGLWADGPTDAYSAEVNQVGVLLYGYNWDTRGMHCDPGKYRLTFSLVDISYEYPTYKLYTSETDYTEHPIEYSSIEITGNVDPIVNPENYMLGIGYSESSTWIEIELLP